MLNPLFLINYLFLLILQIYIKLAKRDVRKRKGRKGIGKRRSEEAQEGAEG